ncbi:pyruvate dehydrogenase (acetyl-transferring) kinase, mitochondrial [Tanacetum coccineum]
MSETMEQYMSKTRADYGSGVARPKIEDKDNFELKGQFLKELPFPMSLTGAARRWLRNEPTGSITTWDGLKTKILNKYCPPARTAKKMEEINNFQQEPDENLYQASRSTKTSDGLAAIQAQLNNLGREIKKVNEKVYAAQVGYEQCKGPHYTNDFPLKEEGKTLEEAYYTNNTNPSYQERRQSMEDTLSKFMSESTKRHEENSNLIKEIRALTDASIRNQGASIKTLEIQIGQMSNVLQERGFESLPSSIEGSYGPQFSEAYSEASHIDKSIPRKEKDPGNMLEDIKVPLILGRLFLSTARAKIDVYKRKITLKVGEERIVFTSVNPASSLIKRVYMLSLRERLELDLEARLIGETLVLNRSLDPFFENYIELNDLNEPFELRRNQGDDLMPTIEECEVIEEFRTRDDELDAEINDYPSYIVT